jgi:hypothetical protein
MHETMRTLAEEAGFQLAADAAEGAEIPFEVVESPGARTSLYSYRPLTARFIRERLSAIAMLDCHAAAVRALSGLGGVDEYLRVRGEARVPDDPAERAEAAVRSFLEATYDEVTEFEFSLPRFGRAYRELEAAVYESRSLIAVVAPVHGLSLHSEELALADDLSLVRGDTLDQAPPEAVWSGPREGDEPNVLALLTIEEPQAGLEPVEVARRRFGALVTALRLADAGSFALSPAAWVRADAGAWQLAPLGGSGRVHGPVYRVEPDTEDELRAFCNLISRRIVDRARGELAWALQRFDMGCDRAAPAQALTDHLLALRALLEPEGPGSGRLAGRVATICAVPEERAQLTERIAHAISLERAIVGGVTPAEPDADGLVAEVAHLLRSLLRDVLCGHLEPDLVKVADDLLSEAVTGESDALTEPEGPPDPDGSEIPETSEISAIFA